MNKSVPPQGQGPSCLRAKWHAGKISLSDWQLYSSPTGQGACLVNIDIKQRALTKSEESMILKTKLMIGCYTMHISVIGLA